MHGKISAIIRKVTLTAVAALALWIPGAAQACEREGMEPSELTVKETRYSVICLINQRRQANGLGRLRGNRRLERAAQSHSNSMDEQNYFSHSSPGGGSPQSRIHHAGYMSGASLWAIGENIRWGHAGLGSPKAAVARWMASPSHRAAILSGRYRELGVGVALGSPTGGDEGNTAIYTTTFGYRH